MASNRRWGAWALSALLVAAPAAAHGPVPAVVEPVSFDGERPWLVQLSVGYAIAAEDGADFLCPALLGASSARASGRALGLGEEALIATPEVVWRLDAAGLRPVEGLTGGDVITWRAAGTTAVALVDDGAGRSLWRLGAGVERLSSLDEPWTGLAVQGDAVFLARHAEGRLHVQRASLEAAGLGVWSERSVASEAEGTAALVGTGSRLALWLRSSSRHVGGFWDHEVGTWTSFGDFAAPAAGPVEFDDGARVLDGDGYLWSLASSSAERTSLTCLGGTDRRWACDFDRLVVLGADAQPVATSFELAEIRGPWIPWGTPDAIAQRCTLEWIDYAEHAGLGAGPYPGSEGAPPSPSESSGCAMTPHAGVTDEVLPWWVVAAALLAVRRRRDPSPP